MTKKPRKKKTNIGASVFAIIVILIIGYIGVATLSKNIDTDNENFYSEHGYYPVDRECFEDCESMNMTFFTYKFTKDACFCMKHGEVLPIW
jgi:hypothetical protein